MQGSIRLCTPQPCPGCVLLSSLAGPKYKAAVWSSGCALSAHNLEQRDRTGDHREDEGEVTAPTAAINKPVHLHSSTHNHTLKRSVPAADESIESQKGFQTQRWGFLTLFSLWERVNCTSCTSMENPEAVYISALIVWICSGVIAACTIKLRSTWSWFHVFGPSNKD